MNSKVERNIKKKAEMAFCECCKKDDIGLHINCKKYDIKCPFIQRFIRNLNKLKIIKNMPPPEYKTYCKHTTCPHKDNCALHLGKKSSKGLYLIISENPKGCGEPKPKYK